MATSNDPAGNPPGFGKMNKTAKDAVGAADELPVTRFGTMPEGYLKRAMLSHGGQGDATAEGANISGLKV